jgi:hypothetical protein
MSYGDNGVEIFLSLAAIRIFPSGTILLVLSHYRTYHCDFPNFKLALQYDLISLNFFTQFPPIKSLAVARALRLQ